MNLDLRQRRICMLCPYCNVPYTMEEPCFCQPAPTTQAAKPEEVTSKPKVSDDQPFWSTTSLRNNRPLHLLPLR